MITDINNPAASARAQSEVVMMWDIISSLQTTNVEFNHIPGGVNCLYLDGHVEFMRYPTEFPCSRNFATMTPLFAEI